MKTRRFTGAHLLAAVVLTAVVCVGGSILIFRASMGTYGASLLEGLKLVEDKFVGEYDETAAVDAALEGLVSGLGDRWSYYLTEEEYQAQNQRRTNQYVGIGVTVTYEREDGLLIQEVTAGGPAEAAGLRSGEVITAVDGVSLAGDARFEGSSLIQGEEGTTVSLEVLGAGGVSRTVEVARASMDTDPVEYEMLEGDVGYVRLLNFYDNSAARLEAAVAELQAQGAQAMIFDMRDNGGGYLSQLTDMLDFLLPEGPIFIIRDKAGHEEVTYSDASCVDLPMVVLVNEDTYSAAEFFAAELQEWGVARIVGEPTSGKGYSQQTFALPHGGAIAISTGAYFTGSGTSLIGTGLTLDQEIYQTGEGDAQLEAALELLKP
ncbi:S41 family peptidase [Pseudoflavonifractor phocaeensis]|uniref:S41 family peptidase n=1 Tax=Pseudoflavonifractor phocaeensis TaxID=1870988 RepID=UPI00195F1CB4|nr:S41 family peptidase [Pseudoflavonifractor phocaeensis]MBM6888136.1 S41 family peptidase [Pseudoflavonifractor phocaeensis]